MVEGTSACPAQPALPPTCPLHCVPVQGVTQDREGYALAAGLALGLITLGKGRSAVGLADLHLEEKLR